MQGRSRVSLRHSDTRDIKHSWLRLRDGHTGNISRVKRTVTCRNAVKQFTMTYHRPYVPIQAQNEDDIQEFKQQLKFIFGDDLLTAPHRRSQFEEVTDVKIPSQIDSPTKVLGIAPKTETSYGSILTFRNNTPFAMIQFRNPRFTETEYCYMLSNHAGWSSGGTKQHLEAYFTGLDELLDRIGALYPAYQVTYATGETTVVNGGFKAIRDDQRTQQSTGGNPDITNITPAVKTERTDAEDGTKQETKFIEA